MGKKLRVFQVARELSISNEAVIEFLGKLDRSIKNQMSAVSPELYEEILKEHRQDSVATDSPNQDFRQQLKEKQMLEELRRTKARIELEERLRVATQMATERPQRTVRSKPAEAEEKPAQANKELPIGAQENIATTEEEPAAISQTEELSVVDLISKAKKKIDQQKKAEPVKGEKPEKAKAKKAQAVETAPKPEKKVELQTEEVDASPEDDVAEENGEVDRVETIDEADSTSSPDEVAPETATAGREEKSKRKGKKKKKRKISEEEIQESIRQTLASMEEVKHKRRKKKSKDDATEEDEESESLIKVSEFISVSELAAQMNVESGEVIKACLELGLMVSINQRLDMDTIEAVADEFGFSVEKVQEYGSEILHKYEETAEDEEEASERPPVVTIMGHVDHGKTSLLDYIRNSSIISGEAGGITQHIGAYEVSINGKEITFLDTPGHEAFTAMRARGAQVTDLVVLVVAADDGVQPQTIEAINHAMAASVPLVVAINKIDKPSSNPEMIKKQLSEQNVLVEEWGGKYQCLEISAKTGVGVDKLLDLILLEAEMLELKANAKRTARGIVVESKLDKGKGPIATVLVQQGNLTVGDLFVAGQFSGKVRAMYNERNRRVKEAPPSTPVQVIGFDGVPQAGDSFIVMETEREVREISTKRQQLRREQDFRKQRHVSLDQIAQQIKHGEVKELNIILKADVDGSNEALSDALLKLSNDEVSVKVIHKGVGGISESDVLLASASNAVIIGFNVRPTIQARNLAKKEEIDIRLYDIIYSVVEDVRAALEGMLDPEITEELTATIEVRETFKIPKVGTIAGSYVLSGKASRTDFCRIYREDRLLHESKIGSLKRFKEDVKEVASGFECGLGLDGFDDLKVGDVIETYKKIETARKLTN